MDRRKALLTVVGVVGVIHGKADAQASVIQLPLDGIEAIIVQYRGQRVSVAPAELMAALVPSPLQLQQMRK